jgi:hypothetical protein
VQSPDLKKKNPQDIVHSDHIYFFQLKNNLEPSIMVYACNSSTWKAEARGLQA